MGQVIPRQHPAVVLKSHYKAVRALLAVALIAVAALAATVVILANDNNDNANVASQPAAKQQVLPAGTRFDGGPDEGTRGISSVAAPAPGTRFDGGPDEGSRGPQPQSQTYWQQAGARTSYQPTPNEGFKHRAGGPQLLPMGPSN